MYKEWLKEMENNGYEKDFGIVHLRVETLRYFIEYVHDSEHLKSTNAIIADLAKAGFKSVDIKEGGERRRHYWETEVLGYFRDNGILIGACSKGLFLISNGDDFNKYFPFASNRIVTEISRIRKLEKYGYEYGFKDEEALVFYVPLEKEE